MKKIAKIINIDETETDLSLDNVENVFISFEQGKFYWDISVHPPSKEHPNGFCVITSLPNLSVNVQRQPEDLGRHYITVSVAPAQGSS